MTLMDKKFDRRNFLKASAGAAAAVAVASVLPKMVQAAPKNIPVAKLKFSEVQKLTPTEMARRSGLREAGYTYLMGKAQKVSDSKVRAIALEGLRNPMPIILEKYPDKASKEACRQKLLAAGYIKPENTIDEIFPPLLTKDLRFWDAAGGGWGGHHAYPCGLITHVASDMQIALGVFSIYEETYGYSLDEELLTNAILLHDNLKPWVLQWNGENRCLPEINIAGTGCHHVQEIADVMYRNLDPDLVITLADSHEHPGWKSQEDQVVGWIKAAAIIAGKDPIKEGYLDKSGEALPLPRRPEGFLVHLGDHDFVLTSPVSKWVHAELQKIAAKDYGLSEAELKGKKYNNLRNYVYSQASDMHLYQTWVNEGPKALREAILNVVTPD